MFQNYKKLVNKCNLLTIITCVVPFSSLVSLLYAITLNLWSAKLSNTSFLVLSTILSIIAYTITKARQVSNSHINDNSNDQQNSNSSSIIIHHKHGISRKERYIYILIILCFISQLTSTYYLTRPYTVSYEDYTDTHLPFEPPKGLFELTKEQCEKRMSYYQFNFVRNELRQIRIVNNLGDNAKIFEQPAIQRFTYSNGKIHTYEILDKNEIEQVKYIYNYDSINPNITYVERVQNDYFSVGTVAAYIANKQLPFGNLLQYMRETDEMNSRIHEFRIQKEIGKIQIMFWNRDINSPVRNAQGVYGYEYILDEMGRCKLLVQIDQNGKPYASSDHVIGQRYIYKKNKFDSTEYLAQIENINELLHLQQNHQGWAIKQIDNDENGNPSQIRYFTIDSDGKKIPAINREYGISGRELKFDTNNNKLTVINKGTDGYDFLDNNGIRQITISYSDKNTIGINYDPPMKNILIGYAHNAKDNTFSIDLKQIGQLKFKIINNINNQKTIIKPTNTIAQNIFTNLGDIDNIIIEKNKDNNFKIKFMNDNNNAEIFGGIHCLSATIDNRGNIIKFEFENSKGYLIKGFSGIHTVYNSQNNEVKKIFLNSLGKAKPPIEKYEYDKNNNCTRISYYNTDEINLFPYDDEVDKGGIAPAWQSYCIKETKYDPVTSKVKEEKFLASPEKPISDPESYSKIEYSYNNYGLIEAKKFFIYDIEQNIYDQCRQEEYSYNNRGLVSRIYWWHQDSSQKRQYFRTDKEYNINDKITSETTYNELGEQISQHLFTYDQLGKLIGRTEKKLSEEKKYIVVQSAIGQVIDLAADDSVKSIYQDFMIDVAKHSLSIIYKNSKGEITTGPQGYSKETIIFKDGNVVEKDYYGIDLKTPVNNSDGYAKQEIIKSASKELCIERFYSVTNSPIPVIEKNYYVERRIETRGEKEYEYFRSFGGSLIVSKLHHYAKAIRTKRHGLVVDESYFNEKNQPIDYPVQRSFSKLHYLFGIRLISYQKISYEYDNDDFWSEATLSHAVVEIDAQKHKIPQLVIKRDQRKNIIEVMALDDKGKLQLIPGMTHAGVKNEYDIAGKHIKTTFLGTTAGICYSSLGNEHSDIIQSCEKLYYKSLRTSHMKDHILYIYNDVIMRHKNAPLNNKTSTPQYLTKFWSQIIVKEDNDFNVIEVAYYDKNGSLVLNAD